MATARLLLVDDEQDILAALGRALRLAGYSVYTTSDTKEAVRLCGEHPIDVVIVDFIMPSMTGIELIARIRKVLPLVRAMVISGKMDDDADDNEIATEIKSAIEVDIFLRKPISNEQLIDEIKQLLSRSAEKENWLDIAHMTIAADESTVKAARGTAKNLKKLTKRFPKSK